VWSSSSGCAVCAAAIQSKYPTVTLTSHPDPSKNISEKPSTRDIEHNLRQRQSNTAYTTTEKDLPNRRNSVCDYLGLKRVYDGLFLGADGE
jgi:hypothetical protein